MQVPSGLFLVVHEKPAALELLMSSIRALSGGGGGARRGDGTHQHCGSYYECEKPKERR